MFATTQFGPCKIKLMFESFSIVRDGNPSTVLSQVANHVTEVHSKGVVMMVSVLVGVL